MLCQICGETDQDSRTLKLRFLYDLTEVSDKFQKDEDGLYSITTCKNCRGNFLGILRLWVDGEFVDETTHPDRNIPVLVDGRTVMMNDREWEVHTTAQGEPDRRPTRLS